MQMHYIAQISSVILQFVAHENSCFHFSSVVNRRHTEDESGLETKVKTVTLMWRHWFVTIL